MKTSEQDIYAWIKSLDSVVKFIDDGKPELAKFGIALVQADLAKRVKALQAVPEFPPPASRAARKKRAK